jgi:hypothetical protein
VSYKETTMDEPITERWMLNPGCWVEIRFSGIPTWRGIRLMIRRLLLVFPERGARIYEH